MTRTVTSADLKENLDFYVDEVIKGNRFRIIHDDKEVGEFCPLDSRYFASSDELITQFQGLKSMDSASFITQVRDLNF
jgi:hypothetical protein